MEGRPMNLSNLGWNGFFSTHFQDIEDKSLIPARVTKGYGQKYIIYSQYGESMAEVSGKYMNQALSAADFPAVGDWVAIQPVDGGEYAIIHQLLPRKNSFSRKFPGKRTSQQILVSNIDIVLITCGLDHDFNVRRIERYLVMAWENETNPVIVLNKTDICPDLGGYIGETEAVAPGVSIIPVSAKNGEGFEDLKTYCIKGQTIALLGSSGVGKSSIINRLIGMDKQAVKTVREDDSRGRHTTTHREMIFLPEGGLVIDNPGMRELQPYKDEAKITSAFPDIEELSARCRFRDCTHESEPGCAVHEALSEGLLDHRRYENYLELKREARYLIEKQMMNPQALEKARWKKISKLTKSMRRFK